MLVISRKPGESLKIGDATVTFIKSNGPSMASIRLGIEAPRSLPIVRSELAPEFGETVEDIRAEQLRASVGGA